MSALLRSAAALLALVVPLASCGPDRAAPAAEDWPEGTAVALGSVPIPRAELEAVANLLGLVNPINTRRSLRREALIAQLLPRAAARIAAGERFELERAQAEAGAAVLRGEAEGPEPRTGELAGFSVDLGFDLWRRAREVELGTWQGPFEGIGNWFALCVREREPLDPEDLSPKRAYHYRLEWAEWRFAPAGWSAADAEATCRELGVRAIQPELADLIPYPYRVRDEP